MHKTITIKEKKEVKNGVGQYGPWTLTSIVDQDGLKYSTFKGNLYEVGQTLEIEYTEKQEGKFVNRNIKDAIPRTAKPIATQNQEKALELLKEILRLVKENNEALKELAPNPKGQIPEENLPDFLK